MILNTEQWEQAHGRKPGGSHLWEFETQVPGLSILISTDGPWASTRDRVLKALKETHGPGLIVELVP